jgi:phosphate-selective porin OprO/OprP
MLSFIQRGSAMKRVRWSAVLGVALLANSGFAQNNLPTMPPAMGPVPAQAAAPAAAFSWPSPAPAPLSPQQFAAQPLQQASQQQQPSPAPQAITAQQMYPALQANAAQYWNAAQQVQFASPTPQFAQQPQQLQQPQYLQQPSLIQPVIQALPTQQLSPEQQAANIQAYLQQQSGQQAVLQQASFQVAPQQPAPQQAYIQQQPSQQQPIQQVAYNAQGVPFAPMMPAYAHAPVIAAPAAGDPLSQMQQQLYQLQQELAAIRAQQAQQLSLDDAPSPLFIDNNVEQVDYADDKGKSGEAKKPDDPKAMSGKWNNQLEFSSKDKNFKIHVGGRTQLDAVFFEHSPAGFAGAGGVGDQDAVDFRRARLRVDGTMYKYYDFACEYDFANTVNDNVGLQGASDASGNVINVPAPTDLWIRTREVPILGNVQIGNMKAPIGLEHVASSRFLDFMERSYNQDIFWGAFNNGFQPGITAYDNYADENGYWAIGVFKNTTNAFAFNTGDGEYDLTGRITRLLMYEDKGRYLLHVGLGGSHRDTNDNRTRFRARGALRNGPGALNPIFADTGTFFAESQSLISPEFALVWGPWLLQAEYTGCWVPDAFGNAPPVNGVNQGTVFFQGWYAEALCFLTGEHREYERKEARFGRVIPHENGYLIRQPCNGPIWRTGAWQVGARYEKADLSDEGIRGGTTQDVTLGLNWFINPNMKYQFNYVRTHRESSAPEGSGDINGFGMRVAFDF